MREASYGKPRVSRRSGRRPAVFLLRNMAAVIAYSGSALLLTGIGYVYGALLGISPEWPFLLSLPFLSGAVFVLLVFPIVAAFAERSVLVRSDSRVGLAFGAALGAASMSAAWLLAAGPATRIFDWPALLYLTQLLLSGVAAGLALFAGFDRLEAVSANPLNDGSRPARRSSRTIVAVTLCFVAAMALPFVPMWQARNGFRMEARERVESCFRLPAGFSMEVEQEGAGFGFLEKNARYRATGSLDQSGRLFSVNVVGERHGFDVDFREVNATLAASAPEIPAQAKWNNTREGLHVQEIVLELAGTYVNTPLKIVSVQDDSATGKMITLWGDGLDVVVRPGGMSADSPGVYATFTRAVD